MYFEQHNLWRDRQQMAKVMNDIDKATEYSRVRSQLAKVAVTGYVEGKSKAVTAGEVERTISKLRMLGIDKIDITSDGVLKTISAVNGVVKIPDCAVKADFFAFYNLKESGECGLSITGGKNLVSGDTGFIAPMLTEERIVRLEIYSDFMLHNTLIASKPDGYKGLEVAIDFNGITEVGAKQYFDTLMQNYGDGGIQIGRRNIEGLFNRYIDFLRILLLSDAKRKALKIIKARKTEGTETLEEGTADRVLESIMQKFIRSGIKPESIEVIKTEHTDENRIVLVDEDIKNAGRLFRMVLEGGDSEKKEIERVFGAYNVEVYSRLLDIVHKLEKKNTVHKIGVVRLYLMYAKDKINIIYEYSVVYCRRTGRVYLFTNKVKDGSRSELRRSTYVGLNTVYRTDGCEDIDDITQMLKAAADRGVLESIERGSRGIREYTQRDVDIILMQEEAENSKEENNAAVDNTDALAISMEVLSYSNVCIELDVDNSGVLTRAYTENNKIVIPECVTEIADGAFKDMYDDYKDEIILSGGVNVRHIHDRYLRLMYYEGRFEYVEVYTPAMLNGVILYQPEKDVSTELFISTGNINEYNSAVCIDRMLEGGIRHRSIEKYIKDIAERCMEYTKIKLFSQSGLDIDGKLIPAEYRKDVDVNYSISETEVSKRMQMLKRKLVKAGLRDESVELEADIYETSVTAVTDGRKGSVTKAYDGVLRGRVNAADFNRIFGKDTGAYLYGSLYKLAAAVIDNNSSIIIGKAIIKGRIHGCTSYRYIYDVRRIKGSGAVIIGNCTIVEERNTAAYTELDGAPSELNGAYISAGKFAEMFSSIIRKA